MVEKVVQVQVTLAVVSCWVPGTSVGPCSLSGGFSQWQLCYCCLGTHQSPVTAPLPFSSTAGFDPFVSCPDVTLYLGERALQWVPEEPC